ncbi:MAG: aminotransferase class III-fold pyridoxal phosphate-dependent enzyme [Bacteroidetes bacterium]|nr:aminotransferase class III-fold pyridoxal phosphate-dependent enzyme [Bacteroidota bacterium]
MNLRSLFFNHLAQTSPEPLAIEVVRAEGCRLWDDKGKSYLDLIGGISVCNIGHRHPKVIEAITRQLDQYLHVMVYGEMIQPPQVQYAQALATHLPSSLNSVYFTNSGSEATEGAMKLAKRFTGRTGIVSFKNSYHGSTQGALSVMGDEYWRNAFRPLLPDIIHADYNTPEALDFITEKTACVIAETIQAEQGVNAPLQSWMQSLRKKCTETGTLLILDEIQCGFGRNGTLWAFESFGIVPDILLLGKALGGGMPLGAFIADKKRMDCLTENPVLGHITTFGGHPVCCAAGKAAFEVLLQENLVAQVYAKEQALRSGLQHPLLKSIRSRGLMMALEFESEKICRAIIADALTEGLFTDWFLFAPHCLRIAPPLTITFEEIQNACTILRKVMDNYLAKKSAA